VVTTPRPGTASGEADLAAALGLAPADLEAPEPELDEEEAGAAVLVRLHFHAERPEPSAFPRVALRLLDLLLDEQVEVAGLCRLVELDQALTAAVLARANAATARGLDPILTVRHAVTRLGLSEVARVAAAAALRTLFDGRAHAASGAFAPLWPFLFRHAVGTGRLAAELARAHPGVGVEVAYGAGLLHDVGLVVAMRSLAALTQDGTLPLREPASTLRILMRTHAEVGAQAARAWQLPPRLLEVVEHHHSAEPAVEPLLVRLVALASALDLLAAGPGLAGRSARAAVAAVRALGRSPAWLAAAVARRDDAAAWTQRTFDLL
jgi:putative nucleotidyltransferase with HDIG domain